MRENKMMAVKQAKRCLTLLLTVVMLFTLLSVSNGPVKAEGTAKATLTEANGEDGWFKSGIEKIQLTAPEGYEICVNDTENKWGTALDVDKTDGVDKTATYHLKNKVNQIETEEQTSDVYKVDTTQPIINKVTGNPTAPAKTATLSVDATDTLSGIAKYSFDNGNTWQTENTKTFDQNQIVHIRVEDKAGNISEQYTDVEIKMIERYTVAAALTKINGENGWFKAGIEKIELIAPEGYEICINDTENKWGTALEVDKKDGEEKTATYHLKNKADQKETEEQISDFYKVDTTLPTITEVTGNPAAPAKTVTLSVNAADILSGIAQYSFDDGETWQTEDSKTFDKNQTVHIKVKDYAGNVSEQCTDVEIKMIERDTAAAALTEVNGENGWFKAGIEKIELTAPEGYEICVNDTENKWGNTLELDKTDGTEKTATYHLKNKADQSQTEELTSAAYKVDTTLPVINKVTGNPEKPTKDDVRLQVNATDTLSKVAAYSFDNGATWQAENSKNFNKNQTVHIKVKDNAGNVSEKCTDVEIKMLQANTTPNTGANVKTGIMAESNTTPMMAMAGFFVLIVLAGALNYKMKNKKN